MNRRQLYKRQDTRAHRLWQQKKIDRTTLGLLLRGDCIIGHGQILRYGRDWRGRWGWNFYSYIR